jgi:hypothetical protein
MDISYEITQAHINEKRQNIFNIEDTEDLPEHCKKQIYKKKPKKTKTALIFEMFDIKEQLTANEILVAIYRLHKISVTRDRITRSLHYLIKKNLVKKVSGTHIYEKIVNQLEEQK